MKPESKKTENAGRRPLNESLEILQAQAAKDPEFNEVIKAVAEAEASNADPIEGKFFDVRGPVAARLEISPAEGSSIEVAVYEAFEVSEKLFAPAVDVWKAFGAFEALGDWHPLLNKGSYSNNDGVETRVLPAKDGNVFVERLDERGSDFVRYTMISGLPVQPEARFGIKDNGDGTSTITWSGRFDTAGVDPAVVAGVKAGVTAFYRAGLDHVSQFYGIE